MDIYGEVSGWSQQQNLTTRGNINRVLIADCQQSPFKEIQVPPNILELIEMSSADYDEKRKERYLGRNVVFPPVCWYEWSRSLCVGYTRELHNMRNQVSQLYNGDQNLDSVGVGSCVIWPIKPISYHHILICTISIVSVPMSHYKLSVLHVGGWWVNLIMFRASSQVTNHEWMK